jgi:two-component system, OmpR family, heavy metal sensor histidine kinase CusS
LFRVKIALLSVLLSGIILVGLGFYSLSMMNKVNIDRIDREILALGQGHIAVGPPRDYWKNFEESLQFIYREGKSDNLIVQIKDPGNEVLFQSSHWPEEITEAYFPQFDPTMVTRPPKSDNREVRRGPPAEAYKACEGKYSGSAAEFINPHGETVKGICEEENGQLVLRRTFPRSNGHREANEEPANRSLPPVEGSNRTDNLPPQIKKPCFATIKTQSGVWRTGIMGSERVTIIVGINMAGFYEDAHRYRNAFLSIVPIALLLLAGGGWLIAQRALQPVALITRTAEKITARALDQRIPLSNADSELSRLVEVINGMLDRLEKSFGQALRFSADAAHELQTPLTILQGELDDAIQHAKAGSEEQQRYSGLLEEVQRLKTIVQKLLILARADAGRLELRLEPVDLSAMIESAAEDAGAIASHLQIEKKIVPGVIIDADSDLMAQVLRNLTSNAVKYNQKNGLLRFQLSTHDNQAVFTISNTCVPISARDREKIFNRFYRVDQSRSKTISGAGLGLSLAREIVYAHHGDLVLDSASGNVVSFKMSLPLRS